jgi:hypothetical protein
MNCRSFLTDFGSVPVPIKLWAGSMRTDLSSLVWLFPQPIGENGTHLAAGKFGGAR